MLARLLLAANQLPAGRGLLEDVASEDPRYPVTFVLFGNIALTEGRVSDAMLNYERAGTLLDSSGLTEDQKRDVHAQTLSGVAAVAERRQDWDKAQETLEDLLTVIPEDGPARQRLGRALFNLDRRDEARTQLEFAHQNDPSLDPPGITLGWLWADRGRWDEALATMRDAVKKAPDSPAARLGLATLLLQREQPDEAKPHAEAALKADPDSLPAQRLVGSIAYRLGNVEEAEQILRKVLETAPDDVATNNLLALSLAEQDDETGQKDAVEIAQQNVRRAEQNPQTLSTLGWAYYRAGQLDEALQVLQAATANGQATPDTAYYMACVLADNGQEADALRLLRSALDAPVGQFAARDAARKRFEALARKATQPAETDTKAATPKASAPARTGTAPRPKP